MTNAGWAACVVNHGDFDALGRCLASIAAQSVAAVDVRVFDSGVCPARIEALRGEAVARGVVFQGGCNRGYAGGANHLLRGLGTREQAEFALILNADVELDPHFAEELVAAMQNDSSVALASGKLLRPGRTRIDSAGISLPRSRRPRDRGSEEIDRGQYERPEYVFAVSGAALMLRRSALADLAIEGEVFDEDFFAYYEDTDLAWRAGQQGWRVLYWPRAVAVHERGWKRKARFAVPAAARLHSFKNYYLQLLKNERPRDFVGNLPWIVAWEALRLGYILGRDRAMLPGYLAAWRLAPRIWAKRRVLRERRGLEPPGALGASGHGKGQGRGVPQTPRRERDGATREM